MYNCDDKCTTKPYTGVAVPAPLCPSSAVIRPLSICENRATKFIHDLDLWRQTLAVEDVLTTIPQGMATAESHISGVSPSWQTRRKNALLSEAIGSSDMETSSRTIM